MEGFRRQVKRGVDVGRIWRFRFRVMLGCLQKAPKYRSYRGNGD